MSTMSSPESCCALNKNPDVDRETLQATPLGSFSLQKFLNITGENFDVVASRHAEGADALGTAGGTPALRTSTRQLLDGGLAIARGLSWARVQLGGFAGPCRTTSNAMPA